MPYEVERRVKLSESDFNKLKIFLEKKGNFLGKMKMKSFLFKEPDYLRIRTIEGNPKIIITHKSGDYSDLGREEIEREIRKSEISDFLKKIKEKGYMKAAIVNTERYSYKFNEVKVELNIIDVLGRILEVEAITNKEKDIQLLTDKIIKTIKLLGLKELKHQEYKKMMNKVYSSASREISESDF